MKALLLLFFTVIAIESLAYALKDVGVKKSPKLLVDTYPKKSKKVLHKSLKLNRRYEKPIQKIPTKKHVDNEYTVFPTHLQKKPIDVPSSPYFPVEPQDEPKHRVKKVLPDFWNHSKRKKRSPEDTPTNGSVAADPLAAEPTAASTAVASSKTGVSSKDPAPPQADLASSPAVPKADSKVTKGTKLPQPVVEPAASARKSVRSKSVKPKSKNPKPATGKRKSRSSHSSQRSKKKAKRSGNKKSNAGGNVKHHGKVKASRRLIGANAATIESYPYVVSIQKDEEHWCTGSILNQRLVVTTANCVWKANTMSRLRIRAGSRHVEHGGQMMKIAQVMKHPNWSIRRGPDNDIALLLTDRFIRFSHSCHAVDLPNRIMMPIFDDAWVASWGSIRRDGVYDKQGLTLEVYHARLLDHNKCNNITTRFGIVVSENFICLEQVGRRAPCTRDTGAPAVSDGVLWGLASWGIRKLCGTERFPAMFTYVASQSNMDFIINATAVLMAEDRLDPFLDRYVHMAPEMQAMPPPPPQPAPVI